MDSLIKLSVLWVFCCVVRACPESYNADVASSQPGNCATTVTALPPDPKTECCGVTAAATTKLISGGQTQIDANPWLALIEYDVKKQVKTFCSAALISSKYVVTGAHCVTGSALAHGTPINIRLGEYDTSHEGVDCVIVEAGGQDCTEGAVRIPIEKIIPHPDYNPSNRLHTHDIALIRLAQNAPFTDFIRPICLPSGDVTLKTGTVYLNKVTWGKTDVHESTIRPTPLHVTLPLVNKEKCQESFGALNITISDGQLCAGGENAKDFCKGDGGAPLVDADGPTNEIAGIVSFGAAGCSTKFPTVYTKVYKYISWIKSTIVE